MNKIFKVIWNASIQQVVVTSELTKSKGKTSSTDKRVKLSKVAAALAVASGMLTATHTIAATPIDQEAGVIEAWGGNVNDNTPSIDGSMSLGRKSYVDNSNSVAVGNNARIEALPENSVELQGNRISPGSNSVALGSNALVRGQQGTAIGNAAEAVMLSTATGQNAKAKGYASVATGQNAQSLQPWTTSTGVNSLANGKYANALGGQAKANSWGSTALGTKTVVTGDEGTALGYEADVTGRDGTAAGSQSLAAEKATASGAQAKAEGTRATASGFQANASASSAVAIGDNSKAIANNTIAVGVNASASGESAVAVGRNTTATQAGASSLGNEADATAKFATALGHESIANVEGAVALGSQSKTGETVDTASKQITTFTYKFAGGDAYSTVSVGNDNIKRTITNVAAGRLESNSTDAINGSQLYTVAEQLGSEIENIYFHTNTGVAGQGAGDSATNKGRITDKAGATGNFGVTAGVGAKALNENTIAIGHNANSGLDKTVDGKILARGPGSIAIGANTLAESSGTIAIGKDAVARAVFMPQHFTASESIAMGENATVVSLESIAIGGKSWAGTDKADRTTGVAADKDANRKINNVVVGHRAKAIAGGGTALGHNASVTADMSVAVGQNANSSGSESIAVGVGSQASNRNTTAVGRLATSSGSSSTTYGSYAEATGVGSHAIGTRSFTSGRSAVALGHASTAFGENSTSLGRHAATISGSTTSVGHLSIAAGANGVALGANASAGISGGTSKIVNDLRNTLFSAEAGLRGAAGQLASGEIDQAKYNEELAKRDAAKKALEDKVTEINTAAKADSVAIGTNSVSSGERAIAMGTDAQALGEQSISIGTGNIVKANNAGAFGDPSYVSGDGSYSIGNNNTITTRDTFVLGSGINRADDLTSNLSGTVANSVYLGKDSEATAGSGSVSVDGVGTLKALTSEQVEGVTSTAGATGVVTNAKVNNITYSNFAGEKAIGAVTVGASGTERRIQNVAAGEISSSSTDAINGSQLYMVANEIGKGFNVTNNNGVTIGNIKPGDAVQFIDGINTKANVSTTNTGQVQVKFDAKDTSANVTVKAGSENYVSVATGETTKVGDADVTNYQVGLTQTAIDQIKKEESVKAGSTLVTVTNTAKNSTGGTEFVVDVKKGEFNTITNNGELAPITDTADGVATVSSVIKAVNEGYLTTKVGTTEVEKVGFGDDITFVNGNGTVARADGTDITFDVNLTSADNSVIITNPTTAGGSVNVAVNTSTLVGGLENNANGTVGVPNNEGSKLVNQTTVANAINNASFNVTIGSDKAAITDQAGKENATVKAGSDLVLQSGKNLVAKQEGTTITFATEDDVTFNNVTANNLTVGPVTINKDGIDAGNTQITNVKAGTNGTDAVNLDQLNNQSTTLTTKGLNFAGNTGAEIHKDLGQTLNIEGTLANDADASSKNVRVDSDGAKLIVKIADNPVFNNITANEVKLGDVVINASTGINAGDKTITNVANGTAPTDAVNVSQLNASKENVKSTDKSVTITEGKTADGAKEFDLSVNTDDNTIVNGPNGLQVSVTPLTNKDDGSVNVPTGNDATKLATAADIANAINKSGFTVKANTETTGELVNPGDTVDFIQGKNIEITRAGTAFTVKTVDAPVFTSVQFGDNGPIIKADASNNINIAKADGSPTKITNVAAGTDGTDAVNVSQLNDTVAANRAVEKVVKDDAVADNLATVEVASGALGDANQTYKVGVAKADVQKAAQEAINVVGDNAAITVSKNTADGVDTYTVNYNGTEAAKTTPLSYKANGENPQTVNLSEGLDFTNGTTTVATVGPNGEVTFDLNDAAKAQLAKEETVKAGSDLVTVTNTTKNSTGGTEFIVDVKKGVFDGVTDNGALEIPTTDGVVTANDIAKVINKAFWTANVDGNTKVADVKFGDTVNFVDGQGTDAAVKDGAITFNVKTDGNTIKLDNNGNLTVNTDNLPKTQLVDGKNTTVSGTGSDSDPYKVNVQGDLADISSISNDGTTIKLGDNKVDVGGAKITNVAAGEADTDAVNVSQLKEAVAGVGKTVVAAGNHTTVETKVEGNTTTYTVNAEKTTVSAGTSGNVVVTAGEKDASGTTNYTVELAKDLKADTISVGGDENNGPVTIETKDGKNVISNLTTTLPDPTGKDNVTKPNVAEEDKRNAATIGDVLNSGWNLQTNGKPADFVSTYDTVNFANGTGTTVVSETKNGVTTVKVNVDAVKANTVRETVVAADKNIVVTDTAVNKTGGKEFKVGLARDVNVNSITTNTVNVGPVTMSGSTGEDGTNELSVGTEKAPTRITNVAPGVKGTDAVNVNQLKAGLGNVYNNMNKMDKDLRGGIAGAMAAAGLYHATLPGKSMVSAGVGNYRGQNAVAVGYSRLSDNGKLGVKLSINANTRGDTGAAASIGYQW
ncbi:YadA-like family protein [[Pasteurella] aerogenes]